MHHEVNLGGESILMLPFLLKERNDCGLHLNEALPAASVTKGH